VASSSVSTGSSVSIGSSVSTVRRGRHTGRGQWSRPFLSVIEQAASGPRLALGRGYARRGQVLSVQVAPGSVTARVQGSRVTPYKVAVGLAPHPSPVWAEVEETLARQALYCAALLAGQVPPDLGPVLAAAGAGLFPRTVQDLRMTCSCSDARLPCKHLVAACCVLAELFDADPFELLHWRGRAREPLLVRLRQLRALPQPDPDHRLVSVSADPIDAAPVSAQRFWDSPTPPLTLEPGPQLPADLVLRQLPRPSPALGGGSLLDWLHGLYRSLPD
jgi:uncharacterized Zn finger protein